MIPLKIPEKSSKLTFICSVYAALKKKEKKKKNGIDANKSLVYVPACNKLWPEM